MYDQNVCYITIYMYNILTLDRNELYVDNDDRLWTFLLIWINLIAYHTAEINVKAGSRCMVLTSLRVLLVSV